MNLYVIEDEFHAEPQGDFDCYDSALEELEGRSKIPWRISAKGIEWEK